MRTVRLGRTGVQVPSVSLGTWSYGGANTTPDGAEVGWSNHDADAAREALRRAHALGITHWDTADVYGDGRSEALLGEILAELPDDAIFVGTKVGYDPGGYDHPYHPELVRARIDDSLRRLRRDRIDLYYFHHANFGPDARYLDDALEVVHRARDAGKIRFIGLSDWRAERIMAVIDRVDPDVVQPLRNVTADDYVSSGLAAWVRAHDLGVAFFSPIRHGLLLGKYDAPTTFPEGDFRNNDELFRDAEALARLRACADAIRERFGGDHDEPLLGALTQALLADCPTGCVLLGQRHTGQVEAAARAGTLRLSDEDASWVRALYTDLSA